MATTQQDQKQPKTDNERIPPSWAESQRFVPRAFVQPTLAFMRTEAAGGVLMLLAAIVAIVWANSPIADSYFSLFETKIEIVFGDFHFHHLSELTVQEWINDALMAIFFFVVGLEIKREVAVGDLRDPRSAALPAIAAIGGMVLPAGIYLFLNAGGPGADGWGIPMATDIAFAVGVVSMVGSRVPIAAKLFLLALAIVDDLGAILVIALFYTDELAFGWLIAAGVGLLVAGVMNRMDVRSLIAYVAVGSFVWLAVLESGVHATIAGVALALLTPVRSFYSPRAFARRARGLVDSVDEYLPEEGELHEEDHHTLERVGSKMQDLRRLTRETLPPLDRLEQTLSPWSSYVIVPLFALANAGVALTSDMFSGVFTDMVVVGIFLGLVVGKTAGVSGFAWLAVKTGLARLPANVTWSHMIGVAMLSGIGFTVALFVSALSFDPGSELASSAKIGIFAGSLVAGVGGALFLRFGSPDPERDVDENLDGISDRYQANA